MPAHFTSSHSQRKGCPRIFFSNTRKCEFMAQASMTEQYTQTWNVDINQKKDIEPHSPSHTACQQASAQQNVASRNMSRVTCDEAHAHDRSWHQQICHGQRARIHTHTHNRSSINLSRAACDETRTQQIMAPTNLSRARCDQANAWDIMAPTSTSRVKHEQT